MVDFRPSITNRIANSDNGDAAMAVILHLFMLFLLPSPIIFIVPSLARMHVSSKIEYEMNPMLFEFLCRQIQTSLLLPNAFNCSMLAELLACCDL